MPSEDGVRRDDRRDLVEQPSTKWLAFDSEATGLVVSQPKSLLAEVLAEDVVLFEQVGDQS